MATTITGNNNNNLISTEIFADTPNNRVISTSSDTEVLALAGNDLIEIGNKAGLLETFTIRGAQGDDTITLDPSLGLNDSEIYSGAGNDTMRVNAAMSSSTMQSLSGDNVIEINANVEDSLVQTGEGADVISDLGLFSVTRILRSTVRAGASDDVITLQSVDNSEVFLGQGNDTVNIVGFIPNVPIAVAIDGSQIQSLSGNNLVNATGSGVRLSTFEFGDGNDTLTIGAGAGSILDQNVVRGGAGNDLITINGAVTNFGATTFTAGSQFNLGQGNDTITFNGFIDDSRVQTLFGDNRFQLNNIVSVNNTITAGDGADTIAMVDQFGTTAEAFFAPGLVGLSNVVTGIETLGLRNVGGVGVLTVGANVQAAGIETVVIEDALGGRINVQAGFTGSLIGSGAGDLFSFDTAATLTGMATIDGGAGNDGIQITGVSQAVTDAAFADVSSVEVFQFNSGAVAGDNNSIVIGDNARAAGIATVNAFAVGNDTLTIAGDVGTALTVFGFEEVNGGGGSDTITLGSNSIVTTGGGADSISLVPGANIVNVTNDFGGTGVTIDNFTTVADDLNVALTATGAGAAGVALSDVAFFRSVGAATQLTSTQGTGAFAAGTGAIFSGADFNLTFINANFTLTAPATFTGDYRILFLDTAGTNAGLYTYTGNLAYAAATAPAIATIDETLLVSAQGIAVGDIAFV